MITNIIYENYEHEETPSSNESDLSSIEDNTGHAVLANDQLPKKKSTRKGKRWCQKFSIFNSKSYLIFQLGIQAIYLATLLVSIICHQTNYNEILEHNNSALGALRYVDIVAVNVATANELT